MIKFRKEVFEVFEEYKSAATREERLDVLKKYEDNWAFKDILRGSFDESLEFLLPSGRPPFTPNKAESVPSTLLKQHKKFGKMVAKKPPCRYITKKLVQEAFPTLIIE